jgi:hypothetical protein
MNLWLIIPSGFIVAGLWMSTAGGGGMLLGSMPIFAGILLHLMYLAVGYLKAIHLSLERQHLANIPLVVKESGK